MRNTLTLKRCDSQVDVNKINKKKDINLLFVSVAKAMQALKLQKIF